MILLLLIITCSVRVSLSDAPYNQEVPEQGFQHVNCHHYPNLFGHCYQYLKIMESYPNIDPKAPLSNTDLLRLLFDHVNASIKDNNKLERQFIDDKIRDRIEDVIKGFCKHVSLREVTDAQFSAHSKRLDEISLNVEKALSDLETKINDLKIQVQTDSHNLDENVGKLSDLDLKIDTISEYHNSLLFNLKLGIQETLKEIKSSVDRNSLDIWSQSATQYPHSCNDCRSLFQTHCDPRIHVQNQNNVVVTGTPLACTTCQILFYDESNLSAHMNSHHGALTLPLVLHCNYCEDTFNSMIDLNVHIRNEHVEKAESPLPDNETSCNVLEISDIIQLDGNCSPVSISSDAYDRTYSYEINKQKQTERLQNNAVKAPFTIETKDIRNVDGYSCAMNVNVTCNAGVYITAIKPTLEIIQEGWTANIADFTVTCSNISERCDSSKTLLVCTQVTLLINHKSDPSQTKAVLHLYHTDNKVQVQGGYLPLSGTSSASWLVKNLIEPLAFSHAESNKDNIEGMNRAILSDTSFPCESCKSPVSTGSKYVRDQAIKCNNCGKGFHKKCTNRKGQRGSSWQKSPWHCNSCILGVSSIKNKSPLTHNNSQDSQPFNQATTGITGGVPAILSSVQSVTLSPQSSSSPMNPEVAEFVPPCTITIPSNSKQKYPSNAVRQKSSNICGDNPEKEFLSTALDACRSTIVQREVELKSLKEALDIRNKKILQLQSQVEFAATQHGNVSPTEDAPNNSPLIPNKFERCVQVLGDKIDILAAKIASTNSINIHNYGQDKTSVLDTGSTASKASQTDYNDFPCQKCKHPFITSCDLNLHAESPHDNTRTSTGRNGHLDCNECGKTLPSIAAYNEHLEKVHGSNASFTCNKCGKTLLTEDSLNIHVEEAHGMNDSFKCDECCKILPSFDALNEHIERAHVSSSGLAGRPCVFCNTNFTTISKLTKHIETVHNENDVSPSLCSTITLDQIPNASQPTSNHDSEEFFCKRCTKKFGSSGHLSEHMETVHAITTLSCKFCEYKCGSRTHMEEHIAAFHEEAAVSTHTIQTTSSL